MEREHKVTAARTTDQFDQLLSSMIGLPNGAHTQPSVVQHIDFYGNATSYMIQTAKTEEGVTSFITQVNAQGSVRYVLPSSVLAVLDRQRDSVSTQIRRRHGKRIAAERSARGELPGFLRAKKEGSEVAMASLAIRRKVARGFGPLASRTLAGHTQEQAAAVIGVSKRTWQDWERGVNTMPPYALRLYRHAAGLERIPFKAAA